MLNVCCKLFALHCVDEKKTKDNILPFRGVAIIQDGSNTATVIKQGVVNFSLLLKYVVIF